MRVRIQEGSDSSNESSDENDEPRYYFRSTKLNPEAPPFISHNEIQEQNETSSNSEDAGTELGSEEEEIEQVQDEDEEGASQKEEENREDANHQEPQVHDINHELPRKDEDIPLQMPRRSGRDRRPPEWFRSGYYLVGQFQQYDMGSVSGQIVYV